jgi:hypothetical protein
MSFSGRPDTPLGRRLKTIRNYTGKCRERECPQQLLTITTDMFFIVVQSDSYQRGRVLLDTPNAKSMRACAEGRRPAGLLVGVRGFEPPASTSRT